MCLPQSPTTTLLSLVSTTPAPGCPHQRFSSERSFFPFRSPQPLVMLLRATIAHAFEEVAGVERGKAALLLLLLLSLQGNPHLAHPPLLSAQRL
mmetsp:Transcript_32430/g.54626  ORF Transcript_32430/g.54626 Transcript_32430/m.54626 type:complete len:94 (-) Transcript_32430:1078-1359(-)